MDSPPQQRLSHFERLTLIGGEELERALALVATQFQGFAESDRFAGFELGALREAAQFYASPEFFDDPASFFEPPSQAPTVKTVLIHGLRDGGIVDMSFASSYRARYPGYAQKLERHSENQTVYARMWRHEQGQRPVIIALHGWSMGDQRINSVAFLPGVFYKLGFDVVLVELPFHGRRAPQEGAPGSHFPTADVIGTNEAMGQVICDLRSLRLHLESDGRRDIGWIGVSLGAYVGCLWSGLDRLAFAVPIVPLCSLAELVWKSMRRVQNFRALVKQGLSVELIRQAFYVHSPLSHSLKMEPQRGFIVGGIGDKMVPAAQVKMLASYWQGATLKWFRGGHAASLKRTRAFEAILSFLSTLFSPLKVPS